MSGAHDLARDAAARLYRAAKSEEQTRLLIDYWEDIETVAEYLGVKED